VVGLLCFESIEASETGMGPYLRQLIFQKRPMCTIFHFLWSRRGALSVPLDAPRLDQRRISD
jgi:hypothetical protein